MADYWLKLEDGSVGVIEGVIMSPTLVPQSIMDAYYRDSGIDTNSQLNGYKSPVATDATTGTAVSSTVTPVATEVVLNLTDEQMHIAPRQLSYELSYWEFVTSTLNYYFRFDRVQGMFTAQPPSF